MKVDMQRRAAYDILLEVDRGAYANLAIKNYLSKHKELKADFVTALVYMVLDHQVTLDYYIDHFAKGRVAKPVRILLRMGMAQMLYMNVPEHSAIDETVKLTKAIGKQALSGFVNAVLRKTASNRDSLPEAKGNFVERNSIQYSYPPFLIEIFLKQWGEKATLAMLEIKGDERTCIHANELKCSEEELDEALLERRQSFSKGKYLKNARYLDDLGDLSKDPLFLEGKYMVQSESAMLVDRVCNVKEGMKVLDVCAAPGGKTADLAQQMGNGEILAWDVHPHRVELIRKNAARLGLSFVQAEVQDARMERPELFASFDLVLVDAPCSGLGLSQGKPDIRYAKTLEDIKALQTLQREILQNASKYVKSGGTLVYATCTLINAENSENLEWFLEQNTDFELDDISALLPKGLEKERAKKGQLQLLPFLDNIEGFYMARMKKIELA